MLKDITLNYNRLIDLLKFDHVTGYFTWKFTRNGGKRGGSIAGSFRKKDGYVQIKVDNRMYLAHRLAWLYIYKEWPTNEIDHINGKRDDNRIENLRIALRHQNMANYRKPKNNTSGFKGVCFHKRSGKWEARITSMGKQMYLGIFDTPEMAYEERLRAAKFYHGEFARAA